MSEKSKESKDEQLVPVIITRLDGSKLEGYFYKPQRLLITGYITESFADYWGITFEEVAHE